jgi:hypothetical protein
MKMLLIEDLIKDIPQIPKSKETDDLAEEYFAFLNYEI